MIQAMIFDLDGTLVQTEKLKARSYARAAAVLRPELDEAEVIEAFKEVVGLSRHEVARKLLARFELEAAARLHMAAHSVETPWQAYIQIRLEIYNDLLADPEMIVGNQWPHNVELLKRAAKSCAKVGLATMSFCPQVQRVLQILKLDDVFDFVASRDDVENGKPDPEIYLLVADQLGIPPAECLVIEDSPAGVEAALAAGMACIAVSTPFTKQALHAAGTLDDRWIVDDPQTLLAVVDRTMACRAGQRRA
jgi:HAD superfamily hydrolase (TIGR01549 family)